MLTELGPRADSSHAVVRNRNAVLRRAGVGVLTVTGLTCANLPARAATVTSTWKAYTPGNWNDPSLWVNSPAAATFPNNGNLGNTYDVVIGPTIGGPALNVSATIHGLTLS